MLHILLVVYLFSAANGLLILALDRVLGFEGANRRRLGSRPSGISATVLS
ncbi:MAG TPA: hypothetical protein VFE23_19335 [Usitatibacter sp.]|nr:hypothetical protein [Usitatibacter sp.]